MDPLVTSSLISGGVKLLGGLFGRKKQSGLQREMGEMQHGMMTYGLEETRRNMERNKVLFDERNKGIQLRVADAKAAGLHPLFALGHAGNNYSPAAVIGGGGYDGQTESGSAIRDIAQSVGDTVERYGRSVHARENARRDTEREKADIRYQRNRQARLDHMQERALMARVRRDEADAMLAESEAARIAQRANHGPRNGSLQVNPDGTLVVPPGMRNKTGRAKVVNPDQDVGTTSKKGHHYNYMSPELGGDELNQLLYFFNTLGGWLGRKAYDLTN